MRKRSPVSPLITSGPDWVNNACVNYLPDHLDAYACGYQKAAEIICGYLAATKGGRDVLVYPLVFLLRHALELRMKEIIKEGSLLLDLPSHFPGCHYLETLWGLCRPVLEKVFGRDASIDEMGTVISAFETLDSNSQAFRYPKGKDGRVHLEKIKIINLRHLSERVLAVLKLLDAASTGISFYQDGLAGPGRGGARSRGRVRHMARDGS